MPIGIGAAAIGAGASIANTAIGMIGQKRRENRAMRNQQQLMGVQQQNQMELNEQGAQLAHKQWLDTNYAAQREQMEKAGLNVGLMYGQGGGGGTTANTGSGGSAASGSAPAPQPMPQMLDIGSIAQLALLTAQKENIEASTDKLKAETGKTGAETTSIESMRDILKENLRQEGISKLLDNSIQEWEQSDAEYNEARTSEYNDKYDYNVKVGQRSQANARINQALLKTASETDKNLADVDLTNKRVQYYWNELMNETKKADAAGIQAAAQKLSVEHGTGEYTNWKTWADLGQNLVKTIGSLKGGAGSTTTSTTQGDKGYSQTVTTRK